MIIPDNQRHPGKMRLPQKYSNLLQKHSPDVLNAWFIKEMMHDGAIHKVGFAFDIFRVIVAVEELDGVGQCEFDYFDFEEFFDAWGETSLIKFLEIIVSRLEGFDVFSYGATINSLCDEDEFQKLVNI